MIGEMKKGNAQGGNASKAGEPPAVVTWRLKGSITTEKGAGAEAMTRRIGSTLKPQGKQKHSYGLMLEYGTRPSKGRFVPAIGKRIKGGTHPGMAARPWIMPAAINTRQEVKRMLGAR